MRRYRFAKIIATLGPASAAPDTIRALFAAGVDVFRLNFSHGDHDGHRRCFNAIREVESSTGRPIGVLLDLQGPKLRIGEFAEGRATLDEGAPFVLDLDPAPGDSQRAALPHPEVFTALKPGTDLLVDDGKIRLEVETCGANFAGTRVKVGGEIIGPQGSQHPRRGASHLAADGQGPQGSRAGAGARRGLGGGIVRPASAGRAPAARGDRRPGEPRDEAREAFRGGAAGRDRRAVRRRHGRTRRPRRGASARRRPEHLPPHRADVPRRGQARDRGDPDAGVDGRVAGADQSRSL